MPYNAWINEADEKAIKQADKFFKQAKQATQQIQYYDALENAYEAIYGFIEELSKEIDRRNRHEKYD